MPYKDVKQQAAETRAKLTGGKAATSDQPPHEPAQTNGKKQKTLSNGFGVHDVIKKPERAESGAADGVGDGEDVQMTG